MKNLIVIIVIIFNNYFTFSQINTDIIPLNITKDSNEYHRGSMYIWNDSVVFYSDLEKLKYYKILFNNQSFILNKLQFTNHNLDNDFGYLFANNTNYLILSEKKLSVYSFDGKLISMKKLNIKKNGVRYYPNCFEPGFRATLLDNNTIIFPVNFIKSYKKRNVFNKYKKAKTMAVLNIKTMAAFLFGQYDSIFYNRYLPQTNTTRFFYNDDLLLTLNYYDNMVSFWKINRLNKSISLVKSVYIKNTIDLPNQYVINDFSNKQQNRLLIESSNVNDFFYYNNYLFVLQANKDIDTTSINYSKVKSKRPPLCEIPDIQERQQWVKYFNKKVYLLKFNLQGELISSTILDNILNESECIYIKNENVFITNKNSLKGNPKIFMMQLN
ncbi:MAG: hypothetical protein ACK4K9_09770 [Bacteroidia bacterium]